MLRFLLYPFSLLYGFIVYMRNRFFDWGWLKSQTPIIKTIVVGNLAVGGTGKSPHIEYLIRLLKEHSIAVLSRGYKRKTKGFVLAHGESTAQEIGDEPKQIALKFPQTTVAVCEDRWTGIEKLAEKNPSVILLDDAFQHRKIQGGLNILLTRFDVPFFNDYMLPTGTLRDHKKESQRADLIIVTKCPDSLTNEQKEHFKRRIKLQKGQQLFFSKIAYAPLCKEGIPADSTTKKIILVTGIANTGHLINHLEKEYEIVHHYKFEDHHHYTENNLLNIQKIMSKFVEEEIVIVTTEKDYVKIKPLLSSNFKHLPFYTIPINIVIVDENITFDQTIKNYVEDAP